MSTCYLEHGGLLGTPVYWMLRATTGRLQLYMVVHKCRFADHGLAVWPRSVAVAPGNLGAEHRTKVQMAWRLRRQTETASISRTQQFNHFH